MEFKDNKYYSQALLKLLQLYTNLRQDIDILRIYSLVDDFNQLPPYDEVKIDYLTTTSFIWGEYIRCNIQNSPTKDVVTEEEVEEFIEENNLISF